MFLIFIFIVVAALVLLLATCYADVLFYAQDFSAWKPGLASYLECLQHPGGELEWIGGWLTQLFYYPVLGASVLGVLWFAGSCLWSRALRLQGGWQLLTLIPIILFFGSLTSLGYWLFCLIIPNHWFVPTLAYAFLGLAAWSYSYCLEKWRAAFLSLFLLFSFPVIGWYAILGMGILLLMTPWRQPLRTWLYSLGGIAIVAFLLAWFYHDSTTIHWKEPLFFYGYPHISDGLIESPELGQPVLFAALFLLALPLLARLQTPLRKVWQQVTCVALFLTMAAAYTYTLPCRDAGYYAELQMMRHLERGEFRETLQVMSDYDSQPTREMVLMKDAALAQLGQLADHAFDYDVRGHRPTDPYGLAIHIGHSAGPIIYYWLGLPNYAYMWCCDNDIEHGFSPHWLRLLYRCCKVNGEDRLAEKYRLQLEGRLFNADPVVSDKEIRQVRRFMTGANDLANDEGLCERFLMLHLSRLQYDTPEGQQIALHYAMLMRQPELFYPALDHYVEMVGPGRPLPRYVGEAHMAFSRGQNPRYQQYQQAVMSLAQRRVPLEQAGAQLYPTWGRSFWWYFDFYTNQDFY